MGSVGYDQQSRQRSEASCWQANGLHCRCEVYSASENENRTHTSEVNWLTLFERNDQFNKSKMATPVDLWNCCVMHLFHGASYFSKNNPQQSALDYFPEGNIVYHLPVFHFSHRFNICSTIKSNTLTIHMKVFTQLFLLSQVLKYYHCACASRIRNSGSYS